MRKLRSLSLLVLLVAAVGYAARRFLGGRQDEWQTLGAVPSPAAAAQAAASAPTPGEREASVSPDPFWDLPDDAPAPGLGPEPVDVAEPADLYDVEPGGYSEPTDASEASDQPGGRPIPPKPFDPLTDPLPDEDFQ